MALCGVPQFIVRGGRFELFEGVVGRTRIVPVFVEGRFRPLRERGVAVVVIRAVAVHEGKIAPRDDLVEEGFCTFAKAPPTRPAAVVRTTDATGVPRVGVEHVPNHSLCRDVPEMQPRREAGGAVEIGVIPVLMVRGKWTVEEGAPSLFRGTAPAPHSSNGGHLMVNVQR